MQVQTRVLPSILSKTLMRFLAAPMWAPDRLLVAM